MARQSGSTPGGGTGGVQSVNGDPGPNVVLAASDVGALALAGGTMSGNIDMGGNNIINAGAVASSGTVSGSAMTAATFNGVALTDGGSGDVFLADDGNYKSTGPAPLMPMQFSDVGNRAPGAALRSGGDLFGNLTPGSGAGQPTTGGTVRRVSWRRTTTPAGSIRVSAINVGAGTERAFILVSAPAGVGDDEATGLSFAVNPGEQIAVLWDASSTGTTRDLAVTVYVETAP